MTVPNTKSKRLSVAVSQWEYDLIAKNARASGMSVSEFIRAVGKNVVVTGNRKHQFINRNEVLQSVLQSAT